MSRFAGFCILGILLALPQRAAAQESLFTPHDVARLRVVTSAVASPDGSQVAYILSVPRQLPREKDGPAWTELHVVDAKGTVTPYITGQVNVEAVQWTPDGTRLSYLAKRDQDTHKTLYVMPIRGGEARKLVSHAADIVGYSWAPDGKQVAFLAAEPVAKDRKTRQDQGFTQEIYEEDAAPVRVWVAAVETGAGNAGQGTARVDAKLRKLQLAGSASEVHWHPKEDWLAVALAPTPLVDDSLMFRKVYLVDLKSGEATSLQNPGKMGEFAWSPDGKVVALVSGADKHDPKEGRLWVETRERKGWADVLPHFLGHFESLGWKDPTSLVYLASVGAQSAVGVVRLEAAAGKKIESRELHLLVGPHGPVLEKMSVSKDGKVLAFVGHSPRHPPEVFILATGDKQPRRLTDSNPWLRTMRLAVQEVVKYKARDGLELEGILVRPLGWTKDTRYPLVLTVHGGPESHIANGWVTLYHSLGQVGAARGLAVFYPNYRGSTGRGVAFSMLGQKQAAGKEFDDLVDAVDHLVAMGLVDPKKVGITGGSYGGYATAWGSTYYSPRFAAGVMFVGISDSISKVGTTDIPWEMNLVHHRKWLWEDWDYFLKSSPIYYTDRAKTPLLILHGKADPRVHPSQSLELYRNLKLRAQAPVRLVLYPGEGHGNRRAASRLDYNLRLLQWMQHYLQGSGGAPPPYDIDYSLDKTSRETGASWQRLPLRELTAGRSALVEAPVSFQWSGRGCPCCIGP
jgi:dipeptidyl aminopeptidase/acylaminoacyl peptidase